MALETTKDFLASLKMYYDDHERFSLFSNMLGLPFRSKKVSLEDQLKEKDSKSGKKRKRSSGMNGKGLDKEEIVKRFYTSQKAVRIYLQIANVLNRNI